MLENLDSILAIAGVIATAISSIVALIEHIRAGRSKQARKTAEDIGDLFIETIDSLKDTAPEPERKSALKDLGAKLDALGLKKSVDDRVRSLGFDDKS